MNTTTTGASGVHQTGTAASPADPANLAAHQGAHQEINQAKLAHKTDASNAAGGAASSATAALGHAVGWLGAKLDPTTRHTYKQYVTPAGGTAPVNASAYGSAAATQTATTMPQGALGSTQAPSALAATTGPDEAYAHGQGFKAHGAAALQGTGNALSHAKDALNEKLAARKYEKYEREQAPMQPKYPATVTPVPKNT